MKTTLNCCTLSFLLLSGCGRSPAEETATESGSSSATDTTASGGATESTSPSGVSDSDSPTSVSGGVSESQTDTGETTAPTSSPVTVTDSDSVTATDTLTTNTTGPVDPSDSSSTSTSDSQGTDTDTSTGGDTTTTGGDTTTTSGDTSTGGDTTTTGDNTTGEPVDCGLTLKATIRDFQFSHPDMEDYCCGQVDGLVQNTLGGNGKPVFASVGNPKMLTDAPTFDQWYTDVNGVNQKLTINIDLMEIMPGVYSFASNSFFPVDNMLWGNEGQGHNFHFTTVHDTS